MINLHNSPHSWERHFHSGRLGQVINHLSSVLQWTNWIGWRQWLVLFSLGATVMLVEIRNHHIMWEEHRSGQTILTDSMLIWEMILFGFVLPIVAGVVISYTGRTAIERDQMAKALELRRALIDQIHQAQSWHELVELIVNTPGNVLPADYAWLYAQRADNKEFIQVASWERPAIGQLAPCLPVSPAVCQRCIGFNSLNKTEILTCSHPHSGSQVPYSTRYCLWLSTEEMRKVVLLVDVPSDHPLDEGQLKVLEDLGEEMSLAVDNAYLHYQQQQQVDIAINVRQRIARDLHDTLGQNISYLRLKLGQLSDDQQDTKRVEFQKELVTMLKVADEAYEQVRDTLEELRTVDQKGLRANILLYASQVGERAGFSVFVNASGVPGKISVKKNRQIMYILREALNNAEKHSLAQNVNINLSWRKNEFTLLVRDDGIGFCLDDVRDEGKFGTSILAERAKGINSRLTINSEPGKGTEIKLVVPISET